MKDVMSVSRFIFFNVDVYLFRNHMLKRISLLHFIPFAPLSKTSRLYLCGFASGLPVLLARLFTFLESAVEFLIAVPQ